MVSPVDPQSDLTGQATALLREWGPVHPGTSFGDFNVVKSEAGLGWVVISHRLEIVTVVEPNEMPTQATDLIVGLYGRSKRGQDAEQLRVVHIEDKRVQA